MRLLAFLLIVSLAGLTLSAQSPSPVDDAFATFFAAPSRAEAAQLVDTVLATTMRGRADAKVPPRTRNCSGQRVFRAPNAAVYAGKCTIQYPAREDMPAFADEVFENVVLAAEGSAEEEFGGTFLTATIPLTSPVVQAFAATGRLSLTSFGETHAPPPAPLDQVAALLKVCGKVP